jgi:hypothetical protein
MISCSNSDRLRILKEAKRIEPVFPDFVSLQHMALRFPHYVNYHTKHLYCHSMILKSVQLKCIFITIEVIIFIIPC